MRFLQNLRDCGPDDAGHSHSWHLGGPRIVAAGVLQEPRMSPAAPRILYFNFDANEENHRRKLDGILRFAKMHGWEIVAFSPAESRPDNVRKALSHYAPLGCIIECSGLEEALPMRLFRGRSVVCLDPPRVPKKGRVASVVCDNAAVARAAFRELSSGLPACCAAVPSLSLLSWSAERIGVFRSLCADAGLPCRLFPGRREEDYETRIARLSDWISKLPGRCAIFASSDNAAHDVSVAARRAFRTIPRDLSLLGVDGRREETGGGVLPRASSVQLDFELAGYLAARLLAEPNALAKPVVFGPLCVLRRESTRGHGRREVRILKAVEIIRREACNGLTAAKLAAQFPGSRGHFERRFREAMGHSVLDEILNVRLEHVRTLLSSTKMPIAAIADFCGFGTDRELRKLFRKQTGMSLRRWRSDRR